MNSPDTHAGENKDIHLIISLFSLNPDLTGIVNAGMEKWSYQIHLKSRQVSCIWCWKGSGIVSFTFGTNAYCFVNGLPGLWDLISCQPYLIQCCGQAQMLALLMIFLYHQVSQVIFFFFPNRIGFWFSYPPLKTDNIGMVEKEVQALYQFWFTLSSWIKQEIQS